MPSSSLCTFGTDAVRYVAPEKLVNLKEQVDQFGYLAEEWGIMMMGHYWKPSQGGLHGPTMAHCSIVVRRALCAKPTLFFRLIETYEANDGVDGYFNNFVKQALPILNWLQPFSIEEAAPALSSILRHLIRFASARTQSTEESVLSNCDVLLNILVNAFLALRKNPVLGDAVLKGLTARERRQMEDQLVIVFKYAAKHWEALGNVVDEETSGSIIRSFVCATCLTAAMGFKSAATRRGAILHGIWALPTLQERLTALEAAAPGLNKFKANKTTCCIQCGAYQPDRCDYCEHKGDASLKKFKLCSWCVRCVITARSRRLMDDCKAVLSPCTARSPVKHSTGKIINWNVLVPFAQEKQRPKRKQQQQRRQRPHPADQLKLSDTSSARKLALYHFDMLNLDQLSNLLWVV